MRTQLAARLVRIAKLLVAEQRPADITQVAKEIYDHTDPSRLLESIKRLGWSHVRTNENSGAWIIQNAGGYEVMITFGGPRKQARAFSWHSPDNQVWEKI